MPADDAAVTVVLRADLKAYEAALKSAVRSTETAARAAEKAVSNVGKKAGGGQVIEANFKKSSAAIANDARMLQFQLNDIFSGIASGQGVRAVQMQLGQIAQQLSGGGLAAGARTLASAFVGMINPINLAVVAFGLLAGVAASYFASSTDKAKEAAAALKKQADELDDLVQKYGKLFPALIAIRDAHKAAAEAAEKQIAVEKVLADSFDPLAKRLEQLKEGFRVLPAQEFARAIQAQRDLTKAVEAHEDPTEKLKAVIDELNKAIATSTGLVAENARKLRDDYVNALGQAEQAGTRLKDTLEGLSKVPGPGGGDWLTSPDRLRHALLGGTPQEAALERFTDAIDGFTERVIQAESGGRAVPNAAGASSAFGQGQFTRDTWLRVFRTYFSEQAKGQSDAALLALRGDLETNRRMIRAYATENAKALDDAHQAVTERNLQLAHFLGAGGAIAVLQAAPGTKIANIPWKGQAAAIQANPSILGGGATREDVLGYAARRAGATTTTSLTEQQRAIKNLQDWNVESARRIELEKQVTAINSQVGLTETQRTAKVEALRLAEEQLYALIKAGTPATAEQERQIRATAEALAEAAAKSQEALDATNKLTEAQKKATAELAQMTAGLLQSALSSFTHDLMNGATAGEAFGNMLKNLASQIADLAIKMLIVRPLMNALFPGAANQGITFGAGGTVGLSGQRDNRQFSPALWAGAPRYARGGMVGLRPGEVPIIAHRGEIVIPNARRIASTRQAGASGSQTVNVMVSAAPSPLLDLSIQTRTTQAEQRAVARGPAVARDNQRRFAVP